MSPANCKAMIVGFALVTTGGLISVCGVGFAAVTTGGLISVSGLGISGTPTVKAIRRGSRLSGNRRVR